MKKIRIGNWSFFLAFLVYLLISGYLPLFTTGGWSGIGVMIFIWIPLITLALIMLVITVIRSLKKIKYVYYNLFGFLSVFIFQLLSLLSSRMDCGDNFGSFSFYRYALNDFNSIGLCGNSIRYYSEYDSKIWIAFIVIYLISIIISFFFLTKSDQTKDGLPS